MLSRAQIEKLAEIIKQHATWFTWRLLGHQYISEEDLARLKREGLLPTDIIASSIQYAFVLGRLEVLLKEREWKNLTWDQLVEAAIRKHTDIEKLQIEASEQSVFVHLRSLEDNIKNDLFDKLAQETHKIVTDTQVKKIVKEAVKTGVEFNQSYIQVANKLAKDLKETKYNWLRVVATEMHAARQKGVVSAIINKEDIYRFSKGEDSNVAIVHDAGLCEDCERIYHDKSTGHPKIFKLKDLLLNTGSNYKRPWRDNAKPVIPPLHPHCSGRVRYVPSGWGFDEKGKFTLINPKEAYPKLVG